MTMATATNAEDLEDIEWTLGERIRKVRRVLGLEQDEFGQLFGVSAKAVSTWEGDHNKPRDLMAFAAEIERLGREQGKRVTAAWLLMGSGLGDLPYVHSDNTVRGLSLIVGDSRTDHATARQSPLLTICD